MAEDLPSSKQEVQTFEVWSVSHEGFAELATQRRGMGPTDFEQYMPVCDRDVFVRFEDYDRLTEELEHARSEARALRSAFDTSIALQGRLLAALEILEREARAVANDHHQPRYVRLDEALEIAQAALRGADTSDVVRRDPSDSIAPGERPAHCETCTCFPIHEPKAIGLQTDPNCPQHGYLLQNRSADEPT